MRRARKNKKQYIIWGQFEKKDIEINLCHPQELKENKQEEKKEDKKEVN